MNDDFPDVFLKRLQAVTNRRARIVIDHILKHGYVTTEELEVQYGYKHPPRAARDVREEGIPLETFTVKTTEGRSIAAYRFPDVRQIRNQQFAGRRTFPKAFKESLTSTDGVQCTICLQPFDLRYLQVDHRVPYQVVGDTKSLELDPDEYMLVCGSCNRAKSWSCEHCLNWIEIKTPAICRACYWASPATYKHIALQEIRRLELVWTGQEAAIFERLKARAEEWRSTMPDYVKSVIEKHLREGDQDG